MADDRHDTTLDDDLVATWVHYRKAEQGSHEHVVAFVAEPPGGRNCDYSAISSRFVRSLKLDMSVLRCT
jgi:hypothetical protein